PRTSSPPPRYSLRLPSAPHRDLHSFPTRRSSDLLPAPWGAVLTPPSTPCACVPSSAIGSVVISLPNISARTSCVPPCSSTSSRCPAKRSEERRVGKECRSRWPPYQ